MIPQRQTAVSIRFLEATPWTELHRALQASFSDYAVDMSYMTVDYLQRRSRKNGVALDVSPGLFVDGELVGFTLVGLGPWKNGPAAFDSATGLVKAWRGRGYASALFEYALPVLKTRGIQTFVLEVLQENKPAIRAYEKSGFQISRELDCFDFHPQQAAVSARPEPSGITIAPVDAQTSLDFEQSAQWPLSWECSYPAQRRCAEDMLFLSARSDREIVGLASFNTRLNWLMAIQVKPAWRRRGVAWALLSRILAEFGLPGSRIRADNIQHDDVASQNLLRKLGFRHFVSQYEMERNI